MDFSLLFGRKCEEFLYISKQSFLEFKRYFVANNLEEAVVQAAIPDLFNQFGFRGFVVAIERAYIQDWGGLNHFDRCR